MAPVASQLPRLLLRCWGERKPEDQEFVGRTHEHFAAWQHEARCSGNMPTGYKEFRDRSNKKGDWCVWLRCVAAGTGRAARRRPRAGLAAARRRTPGHRVPRETCALAFGAEPCRPRHRAGARACRGAPPGPRWCIAVPRCLPRARRFVGGRGRGQYVETAAGAGAAAAWREGRGPRKRVRPDSARASAACLPPAAGRRWTSMPTTACRPPTASSSSSTPCCSRPRWCTCTRRSLT